MTKSSPNQRKSEQVVTRELYVVFLQLEEEKHLNTQSESNQDWPSPVGFGSSNSNVKVAIGEILDLFCEKVSQNLEEKNLKWEAELELGIDFGFTVKTKIKISPKN
jgi:hypothetical protein